MAVAFFEDTVTTSGVVLSVIKQQVLASSDWAHLQLSTGTQNTTLTATAAASATSITTTASIPSGSYITIWRSSSLNGATVPEVRLTTGVSGAGPYTVTFAQALSAPNGTYQIGDAVGVGTYLKATTTRGAQMVLDLAGAAPNTVRAQLTAYVEHDGTTALQPKTFYLYWKQNTGATTDTVRVTTSADKESLFIAVEGPRAGETNAESATYGSQKQSFAFSDLVPYFSGSYDPTPAVVASGNTSAAQYSVSRYSYATKTPAGSAYWQAGVLQTLTYPCDGTLNGAFSTVSPYGLDGSFILNPWVFTDLYTGVRGTLARCFSGGTTVAISNVDRVYIAVGDEVSYGGITYRCILPFRAYESSYRNSYSYGWYDNSQGKQVGPLLFIPKATDA